MRRLLISALLRRYALHNTVPSLIPSIDRYKSLLFCNSVITSSCCGLRQKQTSSKFIRWCLMNIRCVYLQYTHLLICVVYQKMCVSTIHTSSDMRSISAPFLVISRISCKHTKTASPFWGNAVIKNSASFLGRRCNCWIKPVGEVLLLDTTCGYTGNDVTLQEDVDNDDREYRC